MSSTSPVFYCAASLSPCVPALDQAAGVSLIESVLHTELTYYRQAALLTPTAGDKAAWRQLQQVYAVVSQAVTQRPRTGPYWSRFLLERHGYSLHRYMARQLTPAAWRCWATARGLLIPF